MCDNMCDSNFIRIMSFNDYEYSKLVTGFSASTIRIWGYSSIS